MKPLILVFSFFLVLFVSVSLDSCGNTPAAPTANNKTNDVVPDPDPDPQIVQFDVNFNVNDGKGYVLPQTVNSNAFAEEPNLAVFRLTKVNHDVVGWSTDPKADPNGGNFFNFKTTPITGNLVLYAIWKQRNSNDIYLLVSFNLNWDGANGPPDRFVIDGGKAEKPTDPIRPGYTFSKWTLSPTGGEAFNFNTPITEEITLYAQWVEREIQITSYKGATNVIGLGVLVTKLFNPVDVLNYGPAFTIFNLPLEKDVRIRIKVENTNSGPIVFMDKSNTYSVSDISSEGTLLLYHNNFPMDELESTLKNLDIKNLDISREKKDSIFTITVSDPDPDTSFIPFTTNFLYKPFELASWQDLQAIKLVLPARNMIFTMQNDITLPNGYDFIPIVGVDPIKEVDDRFTGILDGGLFTINNLYIKKTTQNYVGLIGALYGYWDSGSDTVTFAEVKKLVIKIATDARYGGISGNDHVGGAVGYRDGFAHVTEVSVKGGTVYGNNYVGGVIGSSHADPSQLKVEKKDLEEDKKTYSPNHTIVSSTSDVQAKGDFAGGLVGLYGSAGHHGGNPDLIGYTTGSVEGRDYVGGLIGAMWQEGRYDAHDNIVAAMGFAVGDSVKGRDQVGGLFGQVGLGDKNGGIATGYSAVKTIQGNINVGGMIGNAIGTYVYYVGYAKGGTVAGVNNVGGLIGQDRYSGSGHDWLQRTGYARMIVKKLAGSSATDTRFGLTVGSPRDDDPRQVGQRSKTESYYVDANGNKMDFTPSVSEAPAYDVSEITELFGGYLTDNWQYVSGKWPLVKFHKDELGFLDQANVAQ